MSDDLKVETVVDGLHKIAVPTPFLVGRVNVYLVEGPRLTLVDTGPNSGTSLDSLDRSVTSLGFDLDDIGEVVLTHQHVDHVGLARIVANRSGAPVTMPAALGPYLADWNHSADLDDEMAASVMKTNGLDGRVTQAVKQVARAYRAFGATVEAGRLISDGDSITIGSIEMTAYSRPGHSPTDTIFVCDETGLMIGGDHLLPKVSSNPVLSRVMASDGNTDTLERFQSLPAYIESLKKTREMTLGTVLPGHGDAFDDHVKLIDERLAMTDDRMEKMLASLSDGPLTALEVAGHIWGAVAAAQPFLTFSEVIGHMDILKEHNLVEETSPDKQGVIRFIQL